MHEKVPPDAFAGERRYCDVSTPVTSDARGHANFSMIGSPVASARRRTLTRSAAAAVARGMVKMKEGRMAACWEGKRMR